MEETRGMESGGTGRGAAGVVQKAEVRGGKGGGGGGQHVLTYDRNQYVLSYLPAAVFPRRTRRAARHTFPLHHVISPHNIALHTHIHFTPHRYLDHPPPHVAPCHLRRLKPA